MRVHNKRVGKLCLCHGETICWMIKFTKYGRARFDDFFDDFFVMTFKNTWNTAVFVPCEATVLTNYSMNFRRI